MKERSKAIDGLKGLCCLPIVFVHYQAMSNSAWGIKGDLLPYSKLFGVLYEYGWIFIYPFFCISGFNIALHYKKRIRKLSFLSFFTHRLKKIYPMVFMSTTIGIVLSVLDKTLTGQIITTNFDSWHIIMNYLLMQYGWAEDLEVTSYGSGTWFICVLVLCYIYYYFIAKMVDEKKYLISLFICFFIGWATHNVNFPFIRSQGGYCAFFAGTIIYELLYGEIHESIIIKTAKARVEVMTFIAILALGVLIFIGGFSPVIMMVIIAPMMIVYSLKIDWAKTILENKALQILGKYSMSIYLSHMLTQRMIVIAIVRSGVQVNFTNEIVFISTIVLCMIFAVVYYYLVEQWFTRLFIKTIKNIICIASSATLLKED